MTSLTHSFSKTRKLIMLCIIMMLLSACAGEYQPSPESDSSQSFAYGGKIPVDDNMYELTVVINSETDSLVRNFSEYNSYGSGYMANGTGYAYTSGYGNSWQEGKGFIRVKVKSIYPSSPYVENGNNIIIKTTDTKMRALIPGDIINIKCRMQYESVAAVKEQEEFDDPKKYETWELDYCRMITPQLENK